MLPGHGTQVQPCSSPSTDQFIPSSSPVHPQLAEHNLQPPPGCPAQHLSSKQARPCPAPLAARLHQQGWILHGHHHTQDASHGDMSLLTLGPLLSPQHLRRMLPISPPLPLLVLGSFGCQLHPRAPHFPWGSCARADGTHGARCRAQSARRAQTLAATAAILHAAAGAPRAASQ